MILMNRILLKNLGTETKPRKWIKQNLTNEWMKPRNELNKWKNETKEWNKQMNDCFWECSTDFVIARPIDNNNLTISNNQIMQVQFVLSNGSVGSSRPTLSHLINDRWLRLSTTWNWPGTDHHKTSANQHRDGRGHIQVGPLWRWPPITPTQREWGGAEGVVVADRLSSVVTTVQ